MGGWWWWRGGGTNIPASYASAKSLILMLVGIGFSPRYVARCSSVVRAFAHGAMGRQIDPSWGGPIELFLVPAMLHDWCVTKAVVCAITYVGWCI